MDEFIRIKDFTDITPAGMDGHIYRLSIEKGSVVSGTFNPDVEATWEVTASGTLQSCATFFL